jgi:phage baseplate assembly protein W
MIQNPSALPIGWPLLPLPDANGELSYPTLELSVRQSIQVILRTQPGEQLMRQRFGAGLERYLHEPNNLTTRRRIRDLIVESLEAWEPRIRLDRVDVREVEERPSHLRIEIAYRIRRSGAAQQMGVTMELEV